MIMSYVSSEIHISNHVNIIWYTLAWLTLTAWLFLTRIHGSFNPITSSLPWHPNINNLILACRTLKHVLMNCYSKAWLLPYMRSACICWTFISWVLKLSQHGLIYSWIWIKVYRCFTFTCRQKNNNIWCRVFINYCVFPLNVLIFLNSVSSAAVLVFDLPLCTHIDTEGKPREARVRNIF